LKQDSEIVSIDEGIQIDRSDKQFSNREVGRFEILQTGSKITDKTESQSAKRPDDMNSIPLPIVTSASFPKYRTTRCSSKSTRKSPENRKNRFSASTVILLIPELAIAKPEI
jgi:hypothetical protein